MRPVWIYVLLALGGCATALPQPDGDRYRFHASLGDDHAHEPVAPARGHQHAHAARPLLRTHFGRGWGEEWIHAHASCKDTPYVHGFLTEPAFLGREVFVSASGDGDETAYELEVEWALSRRLAFIAEGAFVDLEDESGLGDGAFAIRALLVETPELLLSATAEVELPIGDESKGLGSGAAAMGLFAHTWMDFGQWVTLQTQTGIEHVPDEEETALIWRATLAKSFPACPLFKTPCGLGEHELDTWSLLAEVDATTPFDGELEGVWLLGATYPLLRGYNLRAGYTRSFDGVSGWIAGFVLHP